MKGPGDFAPTRYEIQRRIGEGGSGAVYKAIDRETGEEVALKILAPLRRSDAARAGRFVREAGVFTELSHPNIARVRDHGVHEDRPFLVMDFVEGKGLHLILTKGALPELTALSICLNLAETLEYLHSRNIIHRDLKPGNILIKKGNRPVIVDFGFMKSYAEDAVLEESGITLGTPAYMAPELIEGDLQETDERTDIFSLGAVLYEMLVGVRAFPAPDPERVFKQILRMRPEAPRQIRPEVSEGAEAVCLKALAKDPGERYESAKKMGNAIGRILLTGHL